MKAVILCGGLGTRLGELTRNTPKPMLEVAGRPFIAHILDHLCTAPIDGIVLAAGFAWESLRNFVGKQWKGVPVTYSVETEALGTGGALLLALHNENLAEALVVNGDTLFSLNLLEFLQHSSPRYATCIALRHVDDCSRYGRVTTGMDGTILNFGEKGFNGQGLINGGIYVQRRDVLECFGDRAFSFESDYLSCSFQTMPMLGIPNDAYFIDIGISADLQRAQKELA
jgi:D-glycero-alpha-D-manno-heptose 1-phosphate guanylyltransferase